MAGERHRRGQVRGRHRKAVIAVPTATAGRFADELTVIVPAYNEAESLADTVKSLVNQTCPPARVLVVDDC
jgi:cellulose synthase/poly-beta-1,6-N-acetylglucosamine synthase-like glycosyltransferase